MVSIRAVLWAILVALTFNATLAAEKPISHPFVAGFDRFFSNEKRISADAGKLLLTELSCTACHQNSTNAPKKGPILDGIGDRIDVRWIRAFLKEPHAVKPGTTMPSMFDGLTDEQRDAAIEPLIHLLLSSRGVKSQFVINRKSAAVDPIRHEFYRKGNSAAGMRLFHQVGCVACHEPDNSYKTEKTYVTDREKLLKNLGITPEEAGDKVEQPIRSVPLPNVALKYSLKSLSYFLHDPLQIRPAGRMPNMKLDPEETAHIAAYLIKRSKTSESNQVFEQEAINSSFKSDPKLVKRGRIIFQRIGCANCHKLDDLKPSRFAKELGDSDSSKKGNCIDGPHPPLPNFRLSKAQRAALVDELKPLNQVIGIVNGPSAEQKRISQSLLTLNCYACHVRERKGGVGPNRQRYFETVGYVDIGDEGRLPPMISEVGTKLTKKWLSSVLNGTGDVRPHMQARMPVFGAGQVAHLPSDFLKTDTGVSPDEAEAFLKLRMMNGDSEAGRQFMNTGCIQCHRFRGEKLPGVEGIDLAILRQRIQPLWFYQFLENPGSVKPRTRMPTFFPKGKSTNQELLGGDMNRQIAALWAYLKDDNNKRLPDRLKNEKVANFELVPTNEPVLLRTFMKDVGTQAIAVGFPKKLHFVFDANRIRFAFAWKGKFLDAHSTWFNRFTPEVEPLGDKRVSFPDGRSFAILNDLEQPWPEIQRTNANPNYQFQGFHLDKKGTPTFLYRFRRIDVVDRLQPNSNGSGLVRTMRFRGTGTHVWFRGLTGSSIQRRDDGKFIGGERTKLSVNSSSKSRIRSIGGKSELLFPIKFTDGTSNIEIEYQW